MDKYFNNARVYTHSNGTCVVLSRAAVTFNIVCAPTIYGFDLFPIYAILLGNFFDLNATLSELVPWIG